MPNIVTIHDLEEITELEGPELIAIQKQEGSLWKWYRAEGGLLGMLTGGGGQVRQAAFGDELGIHAGGSAVVTLDSAQRYGFYSKIAPGAQYNEWETAFYLDKNLEYTLYALGMRTASAAQMYIRVDSDVIGYWDQYNNPAQNNQLYTSNPFTVLQTKRYRVSLMAQSKNASSSNYEMYLTKVWVIGTPI